MRRCSDGGDGHSSPDLALRIYAQAIRSDQGEKARLRAVRDLLFATNPRGRLGFVRARGLDLNFVTDPKADPGFVTHCMPHPLVPQPKTPDS